VLSIGRLTGGLYRSPPASEQLSRQLIRPLSRLANAANCHDLGFAVRADAGGKKSK
jgi:hypothetical protein